jgi:hypothetical protein
MSSIVKQSNGKWLARYRDLNNRSRCKVFERKVDAQQFLDNSSTDMTRGEWVDPKARRQLLRRLGQAVVGDDDQAATHQAPRTPLLQGPASGRHRLRPRRGLHRPTAQEGPVAEVRSRMRLGALADLPARRQGRRPS